MNNGAFGENFPYTNFHDLNADWIVKIAKDFLDQYTNIQNTIDTGLENLDAKATELEALLQAWYNTHSEDIANQLASALNRLATELTNAIDAFNIAASNKAEQAIASIPADYTEVYNMVYELQRVLDRALVSYDSPNRLNMDTITRGKGLSNAGAVIDNTSTFVTDYIPVTQGDMVYLCGINGSGTFFNINAVTAQRIVLYNSNKTFVSYSDWANKYSVGTTGYIRMQLSLTWADWQVVSITINSYPTSIDEVTVYSTFESVEQTADRVMDSKLILITSDNKLNLNDPDRKDNTIIQSTGALAENTTCFTSGFIPAVKGDVITYSTLRNGVFQLRYIGFTRIAFYDANKTFLSATNTFPGNDVTVPEDNCAYIRVCLPNNALTATIASVSINSRPAQASLEEYFKPYYSLHGEPQSVIDSRKVLWLGTSIPTYGYPQLLGKYSNAHVRNNSLGSSSIASGIRANITEENICGIRNMNGLLSLTQTVAQKQTMIANWADIASEIGSVDTLTEDFQYVALNLSSYETILDPYITGANAVDFVVLNHGYNDSELSENIFAGSDPFDV